MTCVHMSDKYCVPVEGNRKIMIMVQPICASIYVHEVGTINNSLEPRTAPLVPLITSLFPSFACFLLHVYFLYIKDQAFFPPSNVPV